MTLHRKPWLYGAKPTSSSLVPRAALEAFAALSTQLQLLLPEQQLNLVGFAAEQQHQRTVLKG